MNTEHVSPATFTAFVILASALFTIVAAPLVSIAAQIIS